MKLYAPEINPITRPLVASRRQVRALASLRGLFALLWTSLAAILAFGALDYLLHLPGPVRLGALVLLAGYFAYGLIAWVARPLTARISLDAIAARVERQNPWLQDRLRSSLGFEGGEVAGSGEMQHRVVEEMLASIGKVELSRVTDSAPLRRAMVMSTVPLVLLALLALLAPAYLGIGIDRLFAPLGGVQWPRSVRIELVNALPERLPVGQRLELSAKLSRGDRPSRQVIVSWQVGSQPLQQQLMQRSDDGTYDVGIDVRTPAGVEASQMQLWIKAGDDVLGPVTIGLVPRLQLSAVNADIRPPAYTAIEPMRVNLRTQPASVPAGSDLKLTLDFSRAVRSVSLEPIGMSESSAMPKISWTQVDTDTFTASWQAADSLRFRVQAKDDNGYTNPPAEEFEIIARPDQQPTVQLETPRRSEERTAEATLPLSAIVEDDYGISAMALEARLLSAESSAAKPASTQPVALPLVENGVASSAEVAFSRIDSDSRRTRSRTSYAWKLISFPSALLQPGDVIEFHVSARDTYDLSGQSHPAARTPALRITIVSQEQLLQRVYDELRQIATQLSEVKTRQDRLSGDTNQLREDVAGKPAPDKTDEAVAARIAEQQNRAASQSREAAARLAAIADRLRENASPNKPLQETTANANKLLDSAAESAMKPAAADVKQGVDPGATREKRDAALDKAEKEQKQASEQLAQVLDMLGDVGGIGRAIDIIQELLTKQRQVSDGSGKVARDHAGKRPESMAKEDREKLDRLSKEQTDLSRQTENALEQLKDMADRQGAEDQAAAEALRQAAKAGQEQSVAQHQQRAGQAVAQNQSSQASSSQESAEAGLQQMLDSLKDAQRRKLEELSKKLANMQEQLRNLVRRQAGHNLDNMVLRNAAEGEAEAAKELAKKANREQLAAAGLTADQLTGSQQQTHSNSADLVEQLDKLRGTGEVASHLGKAAGRMERAVALLKQQNLAEAFQPPQKEALSELELALKAISDLKEKTEAQGENDQKEKLRKAYEAVRDQQAQIRDATKLLDGSLKAERKRRSDLVRVAQLATDQQKLSDILRPLTEQLAELGSRIFVRTSEAIGVDMVDVASSLSQQKTGRPTQMGQTQIIARLDAIVRALTEGKPDESKYATRSGGGGEGGSGSQGARKLPAAAELMLIRDLQSLVNDQTKQMTNEDGEVLPLVSRQQGGIRGSLDALIKSASPDTKMPDEKASRERVQEETEPAPEAGADSLDEELLTDAPAGGDENPDIQMIGRRMTRSQVRLGEDKDPGQITQIVQEKILKSLDKIIDEARKQQQQQQQQQASQQQGKPDPNAKPKPGDTPGQQQSKSSNPAQKSQVTAGATPGEPTGDIRETAKDWGGLSERDRQAIIESAGENVIEKYRTMTEDYYRALSIKATENK